MNPRNRQFALAGTLSAWERLEVLDDRQRRVLRRSYAGWEPRVYGRFGERQWLSPWPGARAVVKDPFAVLSIRAVCIATGARAVLVYRHPGAVLNSYRRMGWRPDVAELATALGRRPPRSAVRDPVSAMAWFWSNAHDVALDDLDAGTDITVVSHEELSVGGEPALRRLLAHSGLSWGPRLRSEVERWSSRGARCEATAGTLHDFDRSPGRVAQGWREHIDAADLVQLEQETADTHARLDERRLRLLDRDLAPGGHPR